MTEPVSDGGSSETARLPDSAERLVGALIVLAFVLRLALRLSRGQPQFLQSGSGSYLEIARTFLGGGGLCVYPGHACALLMPGYSVLIATFMTMGRLYPGLVIVQSALGAALVWVAWAIGCEVFDYRVGLVAATLMALKFVRGCS